MFITFEGIDFSGKSTQVTLLKEHLMAAGKEVMTIREPGGTKISEDIRVILLDKKNLEMCIESEIFLFSAARAQLVRTQIKPALEKGVFVISDRFHDSTTAYQGYGRGIELDAVNHINNLAIGDTVPDLTFFIDITIEEADKRKQLNSRAELDRIEVSARDFYERVRGGYLKIAEKEKRFITIDGSLSKEEIHNQIMKEVLLHLSN